MFVCLTVRFVFFCLFVRFLLFDWQLFTAEQEALAKEKLAQIQQDDEAMAAMLKEANKEAGIEGLLHGACALLFVVCG